MHSINVYFISIIINRNISGDIQVIFNVYSNLTRSVDHKDLGMNIQKNFALRSGERWMNKFRIDPSSLIVGIGSSDEYNAKIITLDCSIGVWNWKFSTLDETNLTIQMSEAV